MPLTVDERMEQRLSKLMNERNEVGVFSGTKDLDEQPPLIATKGHDAPLSALISPPAVVTQSVMPENLEGMTPESVEKTAQFRYEKAE